MTLARDPETGLPVRTRERPVRFVVALPDAAALSKKQKKKAMKKLRSFSESDDTSDMPSLGEPTLPTPFSDIANVWLAPSLTLRRLFSVSKPNRPFTFPS